ncbi:MAG: ATP-binding protein [Bacteroidia bacterium]|nr:ATP-binding protein [Bacteroidia bacterium]
MIFTIYSLLFLLNALIALIGAILAWGRHSSKGAKELAVLMFAATFWSFIVFLETAAITIDSKILWTKISYLAVVTTPVLYLVFVYRFIGRTYLATFTNVLQLLIVPLIVLIMAWTNEYHHLIWTDVTSINEKTNLATYHHGVGFFIGYMSYSYLLMTWSTFLLAQFIFKHQKTFRSQGWIVLLASICPWVASIFYLLNVNIVEGFDLTPGSIILSGLLFIFAILKVRLLDLVPIAREALVENLLEGIVVLDDRNRVQDINEAAKKQLGIEQAHFLGEDLQRIKHRVTVLSDALLTQESYEFFEVSDFDKVYKISKIPLKTKTESRLIVVRDITETVEKQKEIQRSEERLRRLYTMFRLMADNMPDMLWAKDLDKRYIFVNKAICEELLKASDTEEPIGKTLEYFLSREQAKNPQDPDWNNFGSSSKNTDDSILETGRSGVFDEFGTIDGKFTHQDVRKAPILDENGLMIGIVGSSRDVTLQKKTETELLIAKERAEQSDRLKSSFLANMSHEIRTPLNSILGFISLMQEPGVTADEQQIYYKAVKSGGERLLNTINDIIELSRIDSGEMSIKNTETDVAELFTMLNSVFSREAREKGLQLINTMQEQKLRIVCDWNMLYGIMTNLLKNAVKYTKQGSIEIGCTTEPDRIRFFVKDTGIGIPENRQKDIFDRFVQVDGSKTRVYEGSGLGLSLCKAYVEMMGGTIWVESSNEGSTFYFELPVHPV